MKANGDYIIPEARNDGHLPSALSGAKSQRTKTISRVYMTSIGKI